MSSRRAAAVRATARLTTSQETSSPQEDVSQVRQPIQISGKPVEQVLNSIHYGSPELRCLLMDECDLIFECKVCRALFRDLPNFISHKRSYCMKSILENMPAVIAEMPEEKVVVVQPEAPEETTADVDSDVDTGLIPVKSSSRLSLEETVQRIQSGELGKSHAYKVYTEAAEKLQRQKETMRVATIRTTPIPTNKNAVFVDVKVTSVNIHERQNEASAQVKGASEDQIPATVKVTRKASEKVTNNKAHSTQATKKSILDHKQSSELQKLLMQQLKDIQKEKGKGPVSTEKETPTKNKEKKTTMTNIKKSNQESNEPKAVGQTARSIKDSQKEKQKASLLDTPKVVKQNSAEQNQTQINFQSPKDVKREKKQKVPLKLETKSQRSNSESSELNTDTKKERHNSSNNASQQCKKESANTKSTQQIVQPSKDKKEKPASNVTQGAFGASPELKKARQTLQSILAQATERSTGQKADLGNSGKSVVSIQSGQKHAVLKPFVRKKTNTLPVAKSISRRSKRSLICSKCNSIFSSQKSLSAHMKVNHSEKKTIYPCPLCSSVSYYLSSIARHMFLTHDMTKDQVDRIKNKLRQRAYTQVVPSDTQMRKPLVDSKGVRKSSRRTVRSFTIKPAKTSANDAVSRKGATPTLSKETVQNESVEKQVALSDSQNKGVKSVTVKSNKENDSNMSELKVSVDSDVILIPTPTPSPTPSSSVNEDNQDSLSHTCPKCEHCFGRKISFDNHVKTCKGKVTLAQVASTGNDSMPTSDNQQGTCSDVCMKELESKGMKEESPKVTSKNQDSQTAESSSFVRRLASNFAPNSPWSSSTNSRGRQSRKVGLVGGSRDSSVDSTKSNVEARSQSYRRELSTNSRSPSSFFCTKRRSSSVSPHSISKSPQQEIERKVTPRGLAKQGILTETLKKFNYSPYSNPKRSDENKVKNDFISSMVSDSQTTPIRHKDIVTEPKVPVNVDESQAVQTEEVGPSPSTSSVTTNQGLPKSFNNIKRIGSPALANRPKRKHKVPNRNLDATDMLSKIHNAEFKQRKGVPDPQDDLPPTKRIKLTPARSSISQTENSEIDSLISYYEGEDVKVNSVNDEEKEEIQNLNESEEWEDIEAVKGKGRNVSNRIYVLGKSDSRGTKLMCYDQTQVNKLIDVDTCRCLKCGDLYTQLFNLKRHVIRRHLKWYRYKCKLCSFRCFDRSECTTHLIRCHTKFSKDKERKEIQMFIIDLVKQGSAARSLKKSQTLQCKQEAGTSTENIYARPNLNKVARRSRIGSHHEDLDEDSNNLSLSPQSTEHGDQCLTSDDSLKPEETKSPDQNKNPDQRITSKAPIAITTTSENDFVVDVNKSKEPQANSVQEIKSLVKSSQVTNEAQKLTFRFVTTSTTTPSVSTPSEANSSLTNSTSSTSPSPSTLSKGSDSPCKDSGPKQGKRSLPFNISTRNSPRTFDTSAYKDSETVVIIDHPLKEVSSQAEDSNTLEIYTFKVDNNTLTRQMEEVSEFSLPSKLLKRSEDSTSYYSSTGERNVFDKMKRRSSMDDNVVENSGTPEPMKRDEVIIIEVTDEEMSSETEIKSCFDKETASSEHVVSTPEVLLDNLGKSLVEQSKLPGVSSAPAQNRVINVMTVVKPPAFISPSKDSSKAGDSPSQAVDSPSQAVDSPSQAVDSPSQARDSPSPAVDSPSQAGDSLKVVKPPAFINPSKDSSQADGSLKAATKETEIASQGKIHISKNTDCSKVSSEQHKVTVTVVTDGQQKSVAYSRSANSVEPMLSARTSTISHSIFSGKHKQNDSEIGTQSATHGGVNTIDQVKRGKYIVEKHFI